MTSPYQCPARYWPAEAALLLLNAALEGEIAEAHQLIAEMTPQEAHDLLGPLLTTAASALQLLDGEALAAWRGVARAFLAGIPSTPHEGPQ